jgi:hypothetical protein
MSFHVANAALKFSISKPNAPFNPVQTGSFYYRSVASFLCVIIESRPRHSRHNFVGLHVAAQDESAQKFQISRVCLSALCYLNYIYLYSLKLFHHDPAKVRLELLTRCGLLYKVNPSIRSRQETYLIRSSLI